MHQMQRIVLISVIAVGALLYVRQRWATDADGDQQVIDGRHTRSHLQQPAQRRAGTQFASRRMLHSEMKLPDYYSDADQEWFHPLFALQNRPKRIAFFSTATGKYAAFLTRLADSIMRFALLHHEVDVHVFTDVERKNLHPYLADNPNVFVHEAPHRGWPDASAMRFSNYASYCTASDKITAAPGVDAILAEEYDYLFTIDADAAMIDYVGEEILSDWVGVMHVENGHFEGDEVHGFTHPWTRRQERPSQRGAFHNHGSWLGGGVIDDYMSPPVQASESQYHSYAPLDQLRYYFYGGFYGGKSEIFCKNVIDLKQWVTEDLAKGHRPRVDDESYINALNIQRPPTRVLTTAYMHPDRPEWPNHPWTYDYYGQEQQHNRFPMKILNLHKDKGALIS